jgi:tRNA threonylcarbamoyladenosine biosynthesis protein TsaE
MSGWGNAERMPQALPTAADTQAWGFALATELIPRSVVALCGTLGAGKTHATQGIVAGLGSQANVTSPTFTLVHEYLDGRLPVYHFDFYRMESATEVLNIGWDDYLDEQGVIIVEWADRFPELLPANTRWFQITLPESGGRCIEEGQPFVP